MTILYDEQIIAAVYALKNWGSFIESFITSLYYSNFPKMLATANIIWKRFSEKDTLKSLAEKCPAFFEYKGTTFICKKSPKETYNAFLGTLPQDTLNHLANCLAPELG